MFGMFGIGGPFFSSMFFDYGFGFIERGVDLRYDASCGMWRGAMALCNGVGSMPYGSPQGCRNYIGNLIDWRRACLARSRAAKKGNDLPPGADSPSHGTRGRSYLNQYFYNGSLKGVDQEDVIKSILGQDADPAAKDAFKKKDNILRAVVQKVVGEWLHDPKARGQFLRRWGMARDDADRARALLDPLGNGDYLQTLAQMGVPGALNDREDADIKWQKIANWFDSQVEGGALNSLGSEAANIVRAEGWTGDAVIGTSEAKKGREDYVSGFVDRGYTNEEAKAIMSPADMTEEEAEEMMRNFRELNATINSTIKQKGAEVKQYQDKLKEKGIKKADRQQYEERIKMAQAEVAEYQKQRAEQFLQDYMKVAKARFGKTAQDFGYEAGKLPEGVTDVVSAVAWVYRKLGRNVVLPEVETPKVEEKKEEKAGPSAKEIARKKKAELRQKIYNAVKAQSDQQDAGQSIANKKIMVEVDGVQYEVVYNKNGDEVQIVSVNPSV